MPELTPRLGIKKPLGNENVTRAAMNENYDIIDNHKHLANRIDVVDADNLFTGTDVEAVLKELFTYANSGKTAVANAVTAKGVTASSADTFSTLATKIGQINTGKRWAEGNGTLLTSSTNGNLTVLGLLFSPSLVIVSSVFNNSITRLTVLNKNNLVFSTNGTTSQVANGVNGAGYNELAFVEAFNSLFNITSNGFTSYLTVANNYGNMNYKWMAIE